MTERPVTTLFLLMSVDGKISTGATDNMDVDADFPRVPGVREGLHQYYEIEQTTDLWSLNSGRVQAKIGVNERELPEKTPVNFVVIDNSHLTARGVRYFCQKSQRFVLVTSNPNHPAFSVNADNMSVIFQQRFDPLDMLSRLKKDFGCESITIQTGGTLNAIFLREKCIDKVDLVVAPVLIGGRDTPTLVDGASLTDVSELHKLGVLKTEGCETLKNSYLRLRYQVVHEI